MVTVTAEAAQKLRKDLQAVTTDAETSIRLILSPSIPNQVAMVLDKGKEGDQVVESEGTKLLLLDSEIAQLLEGMVIDYEEKPEGGKFTISKLASDT